MNILLLASTYPRWQGDSEISYVYDLSRRLQEVDNYNIFVLAPHDKGAEIKERFNSTTVYRFQYFIETLERLCYRGGILNNIKNNKLLIFLFPFFIFFQVKAIKRIVKKEKINIIHANWLIPQGLSVAIYKSLFNRKIKIITTAHGSDVFNLKGYFFIKFKKWILKNTDRATVVSSPLKDEIKSSIGKDYKIKVIHNGVDTSKFFSGPKPQSLINKYNISSLCLLFAGRLDAIKGIKYLIRAVKVVKENDLNVKLLIVGEGPKKNNLEKLTKELKLEENIVFIGQLNKNKLPDYYRLADIFIGPSIVPEGLGIVFIEALACGLPVVGTNMGGIVDIIKDKETGLLISPKDSKAIVKAIKKLVNDKELYNKISVNGRKFIEDNFSWEVILKQYQELYKEVFKN